MIAVERFLNSLENTEDTDHCKKTWIKNKQQSETFWTFIFHISFFLWRNSPVHADLQQQVNACWCSFAQCFSSQMVSVNEELEKNEQLFINDSRLSVCIFALFVFPLPQSVQVLRTRRASSCQDRGGVGQRDQGLVSERIPVWYGRVFWFTFALCGKKERKPIHFSCVLLSCQSDLSVWFMSSIGLNTALGKNCCACIRVGAAV